MSKKIKVGIIYGGKSFEHEVSKMTAKSVFENIDRSLFDIKKIYIDKKGDFLKKELENIDVAFLAVHGPNCEDGKLQEYLEKNNIKYTGSGVKGSKINMNKILMHNTFNKAGLLTVKCLSFEKKDEHRIQQEVLKNFKLPVFIKPNNTGSSVGISKIEDIKEVTNATQEAFKYDNKIEIEEAIKLPREIEIGILGNKDLVVSEPGEILANGKFYSYETKYLNPFETTTTVKDLSKKEKDELKEMAIKAYKSTNCRGYARVDFFLDQNRKIYINEINTLPGFTKISLYPKLMQNIGISYTDLITKIIHLALE